jgi:hypothetical protein
MLLAALWSSLATAQQSDRPAPPTSRWLQGDYGPVLSTHLEVSNRVVPGRQTSWQAAPNWTFKALVISLNPEKTAHLVFDTELMRVSGAWTGGFVDFKGANKNLGPVPQGRFVFYTRPGPGWAKDGSFDDTRQVREAPLPKEHAHYKGLYLHGDRVVLSYTVGDCPVLELPGVAGLANGTPAVLRTFTAGPSSRQLHLLVSDEDGAEAAITDGSSVGLLRTANGTVVATVDSPPAGAVFFVVEGDRLALAIPPLKQPTTFRLVVARIDGGNADGKALASIARPPLENPQEFTRGGPAHWNQPVVVQGKLGPSDQPYTADSLGLPIENPWNAWMRLGAHDFFSDGRIAVTTWDGDVWIVSGIDDPLQQVQWRRFATGLNHPMGLKIVDDVIYAAGKDQITRLHDLNGNGEADFYENFNNDIGLTMQRHEFVLDLQTDSAGNFYYGHSGHYLPGLKKQNCSIIRVSRDGSHAEVFASGFREPNGMAIGPGDVITVGDNQGNGIPASPLYLVEQGKYYGFFPGRGKYNEPEKAFLWLSNEIESSCGGQAFVTDERWGPLRGGLVHTSYSKCRLFYVNFERLQDTAQGFAVPFSIPFATGIHRARFSPADGQLYVCGLRGWDTSATVDGGLYRVRYTGLPAHLPREFRARKGRLEIVFTDPLDERTAADPDSWSVEVKDNESKGTMWEELYVDDAALSFDGKTVTLLMEELRPAMFVKVRGNIKSADGTKVAPLMYATIRALP